MHFDMKRVTWLELFYDLAFVALIAQLTYLIADHHSSISDILNIFIVGYTIFIAWWGTTVNRNLQTTESTTDKLLVQVLMVGAFLMSLTMPGVFAGSYVGYFGMLALLRFVQVGTMFRRYRLHPDMAPQTYNIVQGTFIAGLLWLASAFAIDPFHYILAFTALALDVFTPLTTGKGNTVTLLNVDHLQERLGLFLMLVIGESMIVVALANTATTLSLIEPLFVFGGLGTMIMLWWVYYVGLERYHGVRPRYLFYFLHAHGFLFGSVVVLSVGYKFLLGGKDSLMALTFLGLGYVGIALTLAVIWHSYPRILPKPHQA